MRRIMLFDRFDAPLGELSEGEVFELTRIEEVNGEHSLTVTTTRVLEKGWRVVTCDGRGKWREHVVYGTDAKHDSGERPIGTYYCVWSLQHDLSGTRVSMMPGVQSPVPAALALDAALSGTKRWTRGTVTDSSIGGASMYDTDGWSAMATLVENWGGEVDTTIEVGASGVTARRCDLHAEQGDQTAKRRFDFGADLKSVRRVVEDGPLYCRITPRGKGEEAESGAYGRKVTIESVNGGMDYLENASMVELARLPDGSGGWEYPTLEVENSECETPDELLAWARTVLDDSTVPKITYEVDALQAAAEGVDAHGLSLGDAVQVVDRKFGDGLRLSGRVVAMTVNMLDESDAQLTIGHLGGGLAGLFGSLSSRLSTVEGTVRAMNGGDYTTAGYISRLLDRINAEINATGGYTYITEGQGIRTYDKAVSDPLVGAEASAVVEIKGGTVRIANSKTAAGGWEWKSVFQSGRIAASLVVAAQLVSGYIGSPSGNYWDLDNGILQIVNSSLIRAWGDGLLVCRKGNPAGALANPDGSFDVVSLSWSGDTPSLSATLSRFAADSIDLGANSASSAIRLCGGAASMGITTDARFWEDLFTVRSGHGVVSKWEADGSEHLDYGQYSFVECFHAGYDASRKHGMLRIQAGDGSGRHAGFLVQGRQWEGTAATMPALVASDNQFVPLYDNAAGSNGAVQLAWSSLCFTHLNVYYRGNDGYCNSTTVRLRGTATRADLSVVESTADGSLNVKSRRVTVQGASITTDTYAEMDNGGTPGAANNVYITRVEGWMEISTGG